MDPNGRRKVTTRSDVNKHQQRQQPQKMIANQQTWLTKSGRMQSTSYTEVQTKLTSHVSRIQTSG